MAKVSFIFGRVPGITEAAYSKIREKLEQRFDEVQWQDNALAIKSMGAHKDIKEAFRIIAAHMSPGNHGSLLYVGNERVACIFLTRGRFVGKEYTEPEPPEWWKG